MSLETLPYAQVREPFGKIAWRLQPDGSRRMYAYVACECAEMADEKTVVAERGTVRRSSGSVPRDYARGLPGPMVLDPPAGEESFALEMPRETVRRPLA